jgi:hypothetical protein
MVAAYLYPGGSLLDKNSTGFDWTKNFISNLFATHAINGELNPSRLWAIVGMAFHAVGYGLFFINMSKKITHKHAAMVLKIVGLVEIIFTFLIVTPFHDIMVALSSTFFLLGFFYITIFLLKTKLHLFKFFCIVCLLIFYFSLYLYGAGDVRLLAIMQKISFVSSMLIVLGLEYFTTQNDFGKINYSVN